MREKTKLKCVPQFLFRSYVSHTYVFSKQQQQAAHEPQRGSLDLPVLGPLLYKLNVNRVVLRFMAAERLREKLAVTRARGSRFASIRFVSGGLDPSDTREQFLALARQAVIPMLTVYGNQTPPRSRAEMEALATISGMRSVCIPRGKLSLHEEFAPQVAQVVPPFLACDP